MLQERGETAAVRDMLGAVMTVKPRTQNEVPSLLDVVAVLTDVPASGLVRGQVGTVVERLDDKTLLVEFSDDQGHAYAVAPCWEADLLVLHYVPEAAQCVRGSNRHIKHDRCSSPHARRLSLLIEL